MEESLGGRLEDLESVGRGCSLWHVERRCSPHRLLLPGIASFCAAYPGVQLDWSLGARQVDLIAEDVDVAVRFGPLAPTWQRAVLLLRGCYRVYAAPGRFPATLSIPDLIAQPTISLHVTHLRDHWPFQVDETVTWHPVDPNHWVDDVQALIDLTIAGLGLALLPDVLVQTEVTEGRLVPVLPADTAAPMELHAVLGPQRPTPQAESFLAHLRAGLPLA